MKQNLIKVKDLFQLYLYRKVHFILVIILQQEQITVK